MGKSQQQKVVLGLPDNARLVVPVFGSSGGVGTSTVAALLAARLHALLPSPQTLTVIDTAPAARSPWRPVISTRSLYALADLLNLDPRLQASGCSQIQLAAGSLQLAADVPRRAGAPFAAPSLDPHDYEGLIFPSQTVVIDADAEEGGYLADHAAGGPASRLRLWVDFGKVALAPVWVTRASAESLNLTIAALAAAERTGAVPAQWTVVVDQLTPGGIPRRVKAQLALLSGRVHAVVRLAYRTHLCSSPSPLADLLRAEPSAESDFLARTVAAAGGVLTRPRPESSAPVFVPQKVTP